MIGVAVHPAERDVVAEFFELFKTPWEFHRRGRRYDVLICTTDPLDDPTSGLVVFYGAGTTESDDAPRVLGKSLRGGATLTYEGRRIPIYGDVATFPASEFGDLRDEVSGEPAAYLSQSGGRTNLWIGYDLFREVRHVLTVGQPVANAETPTLELHIAFLRDMITRSGIPLVEIPPVPDGYGFMACLTHDIDHPAIRNHWCDHTMFGFLYRATLGILADVCRGEKPIRDLWINWKAALALPFVYLGAAEDFWRGFDRYLELEAGLGATYFVIPRKGYPGRTSVGTGAAMRASCYDVNEVKSQLKKVMSSGCEVGLHGIDAWLDSASGCEERERVAHALGATGEGVRMHWLFFDDNSPTVLDRAGFAYDSSIGYNETVGYRAGTLQAYKPLGASSLMELPLHIMDTALFYPGYLNLSDREAERMVWKLIDDAAKFGGVLTVNWHDRSIAPERLWDQFYLRLINELKARGVWFPTAAQAVSWFKARRSVVFEEVSLEKSVATVRASVKPQGQGPGFKVRLHRPKTQSLSEPISSRPPAGFVDVAFKENIETVIPL
jgi:hypothetical protein